MWGHLIGRRIEPHGQRQGPAPLASGEFRAAVVRANLSFGRHPRAFDVHRNGQEVLSRGRDAAMVTLVDRPSAKPATLEHLRDAFETAAARGKWAVVPEYGGKHGHPILVGREMIEAFLKAPATATAREVEHKNQDRIEYVLVDDPFVTLNVDTPQDYANLSPPAMPQVE